jgi:hypothetical protein
MMSKYLHRNQCVLHYIHTPFMSHLGAQNAGDNNEVVELGDNM